MKNNFVAKNDFNRGGAHIDKYKQIHRDMKYKDRDINEELISVEQEYNNNKNDVAPHGEQEEE